MKRLNSKKVFRAFVIFSSLIISLLIALFISVNFVVDPIIYWLASTKGARIFIGCILSWLAVSISFDLFYKYYKRRKRFAKFNALNVPYPRKFRGRG